MFGINLAGQTGWQKGNRVAAEIGLPLYRDLNGPQLETDLTFTIGWQRAYYAATRSGRRLGAHSLWLGEALFFARKLAYEPVLSDVNATYQ